MPQTQILASSAPDAQSAHDAPHAPGRREFVRQVTLGGRRLLRAWRAAVGLTILPIQQ